MERPCQPVFQIWIEIYEMRKLSLNILPLNLMLNFLLKINAFQMNLQTMNAHHSSLKSQSNVLLKQGHQMPSLIFKSQYSLLL